MAETRWGQPDLPPPPDEEVAVVSRFNGYLDKSSIVTNVRGEVVVKLTLPETDMYKALGLNDHKGFTLYVEISRPVGEVPEWLET